MASPAYAQERTVEVNIPSGTLDHAVAVLSRQGGVSIGFRDPALRKTKVRAVRGKMKPADALDAMLRGSPLRARRVADAAYLIEAAPKRAPARRERHTASTAPPPPIPTPEIIVTGSKRDVPLSVYPGGVQIIDQSQLSTAQGGNGTQAIETRLASVASTHLGPGRNKLFIRGIADSSFVGPTQATVGQYWGNSRVTYSAPDPNLRLYDVRRIEVLEGPQGTLYGAGSLGGVLRVVPHSPDPYEASGSAWGGVKATQHGQPGFDGGALANIPLVDGTLAFRGVAFGALEGGYIDDPARGLDDVNEVRTFGGRAALRYMPDNDWTIDLSAVGQRIDGDDSQYAERGGDGLTRSSSIDQPYRNDFWLADLVASRRWGTLDFTGSIGYASQYVFEQFEGLTLFSPANSLIAPDDSNSISAYTQTNRIRMITGEARLSRRGNGGTGWLLGVSLLHNSGRVKRAMGGDGLTILTGVANEINEATLYGEYAFAPAEGLVVTTGGRLAYSELSGSAEDPIVAMVYSLDPGANNTKSETRFLPSAAVSYRANENLTLFARYQQSFRPGGIAVRREYVQSFESDRVGTAEAGLRYRNDRVEVSATGSWTDWRHIQADLIDGFGFPITANIGDGHVYSFGLSSNIRPMEGLQLDAAIYLNRGRLTDRDSLLAELQDTARAIDTNRLPNVADISGRLGFSYFTPVSASSTLKVDGYARYVGKSTLGVGEVLGQLQGDYLDTGLEMALNKGNRTFTLSLTNLLDSRGNRFALGSPFLVRDGNQITPLQPRTIRIGYEQRF